MMIITIFQATGQKIKPLILSLLRKGGFDIPSMFPLNWLIGVNGILWSSFIADLLAAVVALVLFFPYWKGLDMGKRPQDAAAMPK